MAKPNPPVTQDIVTMDKIVALCKRRGFIFPSSEIYGGVDGWAGYWPGDVRGVQDPRRGRAYAALCRGFEQA